MNDWHSIKIKDIDWWVSYLVMEIPGTLGIQKKKTKLEKRNQNLLFYKN